VREDTLPFPMWDLKDEKLPKLISIVLGYLSYKLPPFLPKTPGWEEYKRRIHHPAFWSTWDEVLDYGWEVREAGSYGGFDWVYGFLLGSWCSGGSGRAWVVHGELCDIWGDEMESGSWKGGTLSDTSVFPFQWQRQPRPYLNFHISAKSPYSLFLILASSRNIIDKHVGHKRFPIADPMHALREHTVAHIPPISLPPITIPWRFLRRSLLRILPGCSGLSRCLKLHAANRSYIRLLYRWFLLKGDRAIQVVHGETRWRFRLYLWWVWDDRYKLRVWKCSF